MKDVVKAGLVVASALVMLDLFRRSDRVQRQVDDVHRLALSADGQLRTIKWCAEETGERLVGVSFDTRRLREKWGGYL